MKKSVYAVIIGLLVVGLGGTALFIQNKNQTNEPSQTSNIQQDNQAEEKIVFNNGGKTVTYLGEESKTALETLQSLTKVGTEDSSFGKFVVGINGLKADSSSEYWAFYVNDTLADEGAGTYQATASDKIEWRLEKL